MQIKSRLVYIPSLGPLGIFCILPGNKDNVSTINSNSDRNRAEESMGFANFKPKVLTERTAFSCRSHDLWVR